MRRHRHAGDAARSSTTLPQSDIGQDDPPRVAAHRPVRRWEDRQGEALANQTALLNMWNQMQESIGGLLVLTRANAPGDAIGTGTELIKANGANERGFPAGFQSVACANFSASPMVVAAAGIQSQPPTVGPGVYIVPAGAYRCVPLRGNTVTIYGTPGSTYDLTTYSKPRPMDFAAIGSQMQSSPAVVPVGNPAAGAQFSANPSPNAPFSIVSVAYTLTTAAAVANRVAGVLVAGLGSFNSFTQTASASFGYGFFPGAPQATGVAPIPAGPFPAGTLIASDVTGLQAADQISGISISVLEYGPQSVPV